MRLCVSRNLGVEFGDGFLKLPPTATLILESAVFHTKMCAKFLNSKDTKELQKLMEKWN